MNKDFLGNTDGLVPDRSGDLVGDKNGSAASDRIISEQPRPVRKFKITIGGESYFLVSDEPEERIQAVARLVDGQMRAIAQMGHSDDPKRVAVLVAMQCASKMLAATELIEKCQAYNDRLLGLITEEMTKFYIAPGHSQVDPMAEDR